MKKFTARLAENTDGDRVQELVDTNGTGYPGVQWDNIKPWWAVVLDGEEIIGCAQVVASKPIGHVEFLNLDDSLSQMQRAYAFKVLISFATLMLHGSNVYIARSSIPHGMKQWKKVVKKRYGVHQFDGGIFDMRVH